VTLSLLDRATFLGVLPLLSLGADQVIKIQHSTPPMAMVLLLPSPIVNLLNNALSVSVFHRLLGLKYYGVHHLIATKKSKFVASFYYGHILIYFATTLKLLTVDELQLFVQFGRRCA
jgi:ABC-type ATPase involved in cell division